ncbi:LUD domain-containing protein [uncultured Methanobacterium sp.]|uniref:LUD domain-containing protein n=1 Tax=uncultured Methanobacterium sp. TaxID=176306 RepID=UPI002AA8E10F|nr:LUD domain-containing protein [uncultured Methanobacterium sp.]
MNKSEIETMRRSFKVLQSRKKIFSGNKRVVDLEDHVKQIRKNSISNLEELKITAKKSLEENGVEVIFAEDANMTLKEIYKIIKNESIVAKSKSNTLNEIGMGNFLKNKGIELIETDVGDRIIQLYGENGFSSHPTGPASHLNIDKIAQIVSEHFGEDVKSEPRAILDMIKKEILDKLEMCNVGITGANALAAEDGSVVMVHNEGNISLVSMKDIHIIVVGIDKLVKTIEEGISIAKLETMYATGSKVPSSINVLSSPSKTADIEKTIIRDMYGSKRMVVIFLDNGRSSAFEECLWCIGCGSCILSCPIYNLMGPDFGYKSYLGGRGVVLSRFIKNKEVCFKSGLFSCTLCGLCTVECPVDIPTNVMIEKLRSELVMTGLIEEKHQIIKNRLKENFSPFQ